MKLLIEHLEKHFEKKEVLRDITFDQLMEKADEIIKRLPGLDCGSCGAPTCKALAEDIVRGVANEKDCVHLLRDYIHKMTDDLKGL